MLEELAYDSEKLQLLSSSRLCTALGVELEKRAGVRKSSVHPEHYQSPPSSRRELPLQRQQIVEDGSEQVFTAACKQLSDPSLWALFRSPTHAENSSEAATPRTLSLNLIHATLENLQQTKERDG